MANHQHIIALGIRPMYFSLQHQVGFVYYGSATVCNTIVTTFIALLASKWSRIEFHDSKLLATGFSSVAMVRYY